MTATTDRAPALRFEYGVAETVTLKFITPKDMGVSAHPPFVPRVMFSTDQGPIFLDAEDGDAIQEQLAQLSIQPGEPITLTKVRLARGGGHAYRVERPGAPRPWGATPPQPKPRVAATPISHAAAADAADPFARFDNAPRYADPTLTETLERSVALARRQGPAAFITPPAKAAPVASTRLCSIMCSMLDAINEGAVYATRLGLGLSPEDLRALCITAYIQTAKDGGRA